MRLSKTGIVALVLFLAVSVNGGDASSAPGDDTANVGISDVTVPSAPDDAGDVQGANTAPPHEVYPFFDDVESLDDLDAPMAEEVIQGADGEKIKIVYRTPISCRDFSMFLETKRKRLERLETAVDRKTAVLTKLKEEFDSVSGKYAGLESRVKNLIQKDPMDLKNNPELARMIKLYETLSPEEAAARLRNLDLDLTLAVLKGMKAKRLSQVMSALEPKLAAALSSQMVRGF